MCALAVLATDNACFTVDADSLAGLLLTAFGKKYVLIFVVRQVGASPALVHIFREVTGGKDSIYAV